MTTAVISLVGVGFVLQLLAMVRMDRVLHDAGIETDAYYYPRWVLKWAQLYRAVTLDRTGKIGDTYYMFWVGFALGWSDLLLGLLFFD